jgi:16S rRNA (guanine527-N7)-methyltransferase
MELEEQLVFKYFDKLSEVQKEQFKQLGPLYRHWNEQINLISRKDIDKIYTHHILHSLAIAKYHNFKPGSEILDLGTGGGFPGIPLAIVFPEVNFHLVDRKAKKIKVVQDIIEKLDLENVFAQHVTAEELDSKYDFVVNRAVALSDKLWTWIDPLVKKKNINAIPNGLISLKGGDLTAELQNLRKKEYVEVSPISDYFDEPYFETKSIVYIQK